MERLFGHREYMKLPEATREHAMQYWEVHIKPHYMHDMDVAVPFTGIRNRPRVRLDKGFLQLNKYRAWATSSFDHA